MSEGWIKLHRQLQDNPIWKSEPFTRGQAWVDLILLANHEAGYIYVRDHKIELKRGDVGWSQNRLSERWQWSRTKVRKFLDDLEKEQQIKQIKSHSYTIIKLINYKEYQKKEEEKTTEKQQKDKSETTEKQQKDTNKNVKNEENEKESIYSQRIFDVIEGIESIEDKNVVLAMHIWKDVNDLQPNNQTTLKANVETWSEPIRLMVERDGRTYEEIWNLWKRVQKDSFWITNILSTAKLREQFDHLKIKLNKNGTTTKSQIDRNAELLGYTADTG